MNLFSLIPSFKKRYQFYHWPMRWHLYLAIALTLLLRVLVANFAFGPQSLDDYNHGLVPALRWSQGLPSAIPDYRNHLIVWIVGSVFKFCDLIHIEDSLLRLKFAYVGIGLFSILTLLGVLLLLSTMKNKLPKLFVLYAMGINPMFAFVSSRILGESVSIGFLIFGMGLVHWGMQKNRHWSSIVWGLFFVGLAALFRFQLGIVYICYLAYFLIQRNFKLVQMALAVGLGLVLFQIGVDHLSGKYPLETLIAYININKNGAKEFGVTPWYSTWFLFFSFLFLPFSWPLFRNVLKSVKEYYYLIIFMLVFVAFHSAIPHKEERFLFPIFPLTLFFVSLFAFWKRKEKWVKWCHTPYFVFINGLFLFVGVLSNSQESVVGPVARYSPTKAQELVVEIGPLFGNKGLREYFIQNNQNYMEFPDVSSFNKFIQDNQALQSERKVILIPSANFPEETVSQLKQSLTGCSDVQKFQSLSDSILYHLNPRINPRRVPSWRLICG